MAADEERDRKLKPVEDAPTPRSHTTSEIVTAASTAVGEKVIVELGRSLARALEGGRASAWAITTAVLGLALIGAASVVAGWMLTREDECSPLLIEHVLRQNEVGQKLEQDLIDAGEPAVARSIRELTDIDNQPDNVKICALLRK